jgi:hypothetical protein
MDLDDALIAMLAGGFGLSIAFLAAEYLGWRALRAAERSRERAERELRAAKLAQQGAAAPLRSIAVREESTAEGAPERRTPRMRSMRIFPFVERRRRTGTRDPSGSVGRNG